VQWRRHARATARRLNLGWWFERMIPLVIGLSLAGAVAVLLLRSSGAVVPAAAFAGWAAGLTLAAGALAFALARGRFWTEDDALVRLEDRLGLHNALTAARCGAAPWPAAPVRAAHGFVWRWPSLVLPLLAGAVLVAGAGLSRVAPGARGGASAISPPPAWEQIESDLAVLEEEEFVEPEALERFQERLAELQQQPEEEWYSHASLEASDHERARLQSAVNDLATNLEKSERALALLQDYSDQLGKAATERLLAEFADGVKGLELGELPPDSELAKALKSIDPSQLKSLSSEQLAALRESLKRNAAACQQCSGQGSQPGGWGDLSDEELLSLINGNSPGQGPNGNQPGRGGVTRGPGSSPLTLAGAESQLGTRNLEGVASADLSRAAPADLIGITTGEHELDKTATGPQSGGEANTGRGGEAVWKETLLPGEQSVLRRYFE
jgi:hypothetical protein